MGQSITAGLQKLCSGESLDLSEEEGKAEQPEGQVVAVDKVGGDQGS